MYNAEAAQGNQAINNLQVGVTAEDSADKVMDEFATQNETALAAIIGGRSTIHQHLLSLIQQAITNPITEFHRIHKLNDKSKQIASAILPTQLSDAAQCIVMVLQAERPAERLVLCRLICEHADKSIDNIQQCLQSLKAKAAKQSITTSGCPTTQKNAKVNGKESTTKSTPKSILKGTGNAITAKMPRRTKKFLKQAKLPPANAKLSPKDQQAKLPSGNQFATLDNDNIQTFIRAEKKGRSTSKSNKDKRKSWIPTNHLASFQTL
jgi:hypothetical protein